MKIITRPIPVKFTEDELETIANAMADYIHYDDPDIDPDDLIGGISVADRVDSIQHKISVALFRLNS
tara:strand:- start:63 stop:263 length:201 start_codon:yes stop_codon:yes gene_type:complete